MIGMSNQVLGRIEIADLLDVDSRTPHAWCARKLLPDPTYPSVNGSPAWERQEILRWAAATGRLPSGLRAEAKLLGLSIGELPRGGRKVKEAA